MAANGISTLVTKELRQKAKLDLAALNRAADGNPRSVYDITQLPTQYSGNELIDNPNVGGLVYGRPWITSSNIQGSIITTDDNKILLTEDGKILILE